MQKVVGSSPISRVEEALQIAGFFRLTTEREVRDGGVVVGVDAFDRPAPAVDGLDQL